jgi:SAM-dependent methyltransferase
MHSLIKCPACDHSEMHSVFSGHAPDNSLARLAKKPLPFLLPGFDVIAHAVSDWHVCRHCALLFAKNRPDVKGTSNWYPQLFQHSEERSYNTPELPLAYVEGKARSSKEFLNFLGQHDLFKHAKSLIQFRTGPGHLLSEAEKQYPGLDVYGLEYFEHPAAYARTLVGKEKIAVIDVPEPKHPFALRTFDVIIANHFLTHAHDPRALMTYFRSILSDAGTLVIYNELDHDLSLKSMTAYARGLNFFHKQLFTRKTLIGFVQACGFAVEEIIAAGPAKKRKYITLLCRKAEPHAIPKGNPAEAAKLLQSWRRKHRFYKFAKPLIDPVRKLMA